MLRYAWADSDDSEGDAAEEEQKAKLMVVERAWTHVYALGDNDDAPIVIVRANQVPRTAAIEDCKAQTVRVVIEDLSQPRPMRPDNGAFLRVVAVSTTDEHATNSLVERWIAQDHETNVLHIPDAVHKVSAVAKKTLALKPEVVSQTIQYGLAISCAGGKASMRRSLKRIIRREGMVKVRYEPLDRESMEYRARVLNVFCSDGETGKRSGLVYSIAKHLINGDWRNRSAIEHICHPGCCMNIAHTKRKMCRFLPKAFVTHFLKPFPRDNFTGSDSVIGSHGIFEAVHALSSQTFLETFRTKRSSSSLLPAVVGPPPPALADQPPSIFEGHLGVV
jgi:hypothetical protein